MSASSPVAFLFVELDFSVKHVNIRPPRYHAAGRRVSAVCARSDIGAAGGRVVHENIALHDGVAYDQRVLCDRSSPPVYAPRLAVGAGRQA